MSPPALILTVSSQCSVYAGIHSGFFCLGLMVQRSPLWTIPGSGLKQKRVKFIPRESAKRTLKWIGHMAGSQTTYGKSHATALVHFWPLAYALNTSTTTATSNHKIRMNYNNFWLRKARYRLSLSQSQVSLLFFFSKEHTKQPFSSR